MFPTSLSFSLFIQLLLSYWFDCYDNGADESTNGGNDDTKYGDGSGSSSSSSSGSTAHGGGSGGGSGTNSSGVRARMKHGLSVAKSKLAEFLPGSAEEAEDALKVLYS